MKTTKSYNVQIWAGLREGYTDTIHSITEVEKIVDEFIKKEKDCITITPTQFRYVDGDEPGVIIGWINYPRFPRDPEEINKRALSLAEKLMIEMKQERISISTPTDTFMLENTLDKVKFEEGETVVCKWGLNHITNKPFEFLYDFGYYTDFGCVVYNHGERNMQDSGAFKLYQVRRATQEDMKNLYWGD